MNAFVEMCIAAVASGRITIHQVPLQYREAVKAATRRFFRRQLGWYRRDPRITWLEATHPGNVAVILSALGLPQHAGGGHHATL